ncbi:MAG: SusC/RagA family TonB-linked outer membrane protein [Paludibacteraceae bacterium]|nr:SusC/RagA family TonB-linked outer membrane protein [Paludibacteraceae bacterium]
MTKKLHRAILLALVSVASIAASYAQTAITGTVTDETGEPIIGAYITLESDKSVGTITDFDGNYEISVPADSKLIFSYTGYESQTLSTSGKSSLSVVLKEASTHLEEVVAVGYGSQKAKEITSAVSSVKSENFNAGVTSSPMGLIQGKVAGLTITNTNGGDPTSTGLNVQIRGTSTLNAGAGSTPLYIVDGVPVSSIDNIAPEDIASMDVLKDGSSAAIYGTRGTNGVILITTKRGSSSEGVECGTTNFEYAGYVSVAHKTGKTGMTTIDEYVNMEDWTNGKFTPYNHGSYSDYYSMMSREAPVTTNHNFAITGATKKFNYRASVNYKYAEGIAKDRQEINAKFSANQKAFEGWLDLQYDFSYMHYKNNNAWTQFDMAATLNPTYPVYDKSTKSGFYLIEASGFNNPIEPYVLNSEYSDGNFFRGSVRATVNILPVKGLKANGFVAFEEGDNYNYKYNSIKYVASPDEAGKATRWQGRDMNILAEGTIDYAGQWSGHSLALVGGFSYQQFSHDESKMENSGFATDNIMYYKMQEGDATKVKLNVDSKREFNALASAFFRANYNYKEKYLLSASIRAEGSSRFGKNNRWGWFPAASVGWRITGEDFMQNVNGVDDLKIRFGFGITGNNVGQNLASKELLGAGGTFWYNGEWVKTYNVTQNANPDLKWERKFEYNLGIDFSFLSNRLYGSIDMYIRDTKDLLYWYDVPSPPYQFNKLLSNAGEIRAKGIEVALTGVPIKTKNWLWTSTWTMAFDNSKIKSLSDPAKGLNYTEVLSGNIGGNGLNDVKTQIIREGESIGVFYGYRYDHVDPETHELWYKKKDGSITKNEADLKEEDKAIVGKAQPIMTYGWNNTVKWKWLDFTIFFRGMVGNKVLNVTRWAYTPTKAGQQANMVYKSTTEAIAKGNGAYRAGVFSDYWLEDGSYLRCDNITVGFTIPLKPNKYVKHLRLYVTGQNLFTITKYSGLDPEVNVSSIDNAGINYIGFYPRVSSYLFGVNVTF